MATYMGQITESGEFGIVMKDSRIMNPAESLKVENHSPDGFSWGYKGSGPAQLALAILLEHWEWNSIMGGFAEEVGSFFSPHIKALRHYQRFMKDVIAKMPKDSNWQITSKEISNWYITRKWIPPKMGHTDEKKVMHDNVVDTNVLLDNVIGDGRYTRFHDLIEFLRAGGEIEIRSNLAGLAQEVNTGDLIYIGEALQINPDDEDSDITQEEWDQAAREDAAWTAEAADPNPQAGRGE